MSDLRVAFTLSERDVAFLRRLIRHAGARAKGQDENAIINAAVEMTRRVREAKPPQYVIEQVEKLERIIALAQDKDWNLPVKTRQRVTTALAYFTAPHDLIPDRVPGLGYLDDAIMIELVARDLGHEIRGYDEYQRYKHGGVQRPWVSGADAKLTDRKKRIRARIAAAEGKAAAEGPARGFWLW